MNKGNEVNRSSKSVKLRPFPYPFRAGLAVCSDIDGCDRETFVAVHRFLNRKKGGLGLPVSDSFFAVGRQPGQMAYFLPNGCDRSPDADFIIRAVKDGLIDSLHSWGDFNESPPDPVFLREVAKKLNDELSKHDLSINVWINHGSPNNRQNLRARLERGYNGDDPKSPYYTADLIHNLGIRFYWWSEVLPWPLSCHRSNMRPDVWARLGINALKNLIKLFSGRRHQIRQSSQLMSLAQAIVLKDKSKLIGFTRFNGCPQGVWHLPTRHSFRHSLSPRVLKTLIENEGYLVIYTHLGLPLERSDKIFPRPDEEALFRLAHHYDSGNIWVAPTERLLTYWLTRKFLVWEAAQRGGEIVIDLISLNDPVSGIRIPSQK